MLDRYTTEHMRDIWSDEARIHAWCDVEIAAARAAGASTWVIETLNNTPLPPLVAIQDRESEVAHDVVAFLDVWRLGMPPEVASWVHRGMTSSDLVDTANAVIMRRASFEIRTGLAGLVQATARHAIHHWNTRRLARTHGQAAEASTWGYWLANIAATLDRASSRFDSAVQAVSVAKLSGPVGNYRYFTYAQERNFASILGLNPVGVATQVVMRDRYADWVFALAQIATVIEALALEVRLCQQTGIDELAESTRPDQVGSSAMPHKQNPIVSEQLCGLAKVVRAQIGPTLEGVAIWHERDISHSSVERHTLRLASSLVDYMLRRATRLIVNLRVRTDNMLRNLEVAGNCVDSANRKFKLMSEGEHPDGVDAKVRAKLEHDSPAPLRTDTAHVLDYMKQLAM